MKNVNNINFIKKRNKNNIFHQDLWGLARSHQGLYGGVLGTFAKTNKKSTFNENATSIIVNVDDDDSKQDILDSQNITKGKAVNQLNLSDTDEDDEDDDDDIDVNYMGNENVNENDHQKQSLFNFGNKDQKQSLFNFGNNSSDKFSKRFSFNKDKSQSLFNFAPNNNNSNLDYGFGVGHNNPNVNIIDLQGALTENRILNSRLAQMRHDFDQHMASMQMDKEDAEQRAELISKRVDLLETQKENIETKKRDIEKRADLLSIEKQEAINRADLLELDKQDAINRVKLLTTQNEEQDVLINKAMQDLKDLKDTQITQGLDTDMIEELSQLKETIELKDKEIQNLQNKLDTSDKTQQIDQLTKTIDELTQTINTKNTDILNKQQENIQLSNEITQLKSLSNKVQQYETYTEQLKQQISQENERYNTAQNQVIVLQQKLSGTDEEKTLHTKTITSYQTQLDTLNKEMTTLQTTIRSKNNQISKLVGVETQNKSLENKIKEYETRHNQKTMELETATKQMQTLKSNVDQMSSKLKLAETSVSRYKEFQKEWNKKEHQYVQQNTENKRQLLTMSTDLSASQSTQQSLTLQLTNANNKIKTAQSQIDILEKNQQQLSLVKATTTSETDQLRTDKASLTNQLHSIEAKLVEIEHQNNLLKNEMKQKEQFSLQLVQKNTQDQDALFKKMNESSNDYQRQLDELTNKLRKSYSDKLQVEQQLHQQKQLTQQAQTNEQNAQRQITRLQNLQSSNTLSIMPPQLSNTSNTLSIMPSQTTTASSPTIQQSQTQPQIQPQTQTQNIDDDAKMSDVRTISTHQDLTNFEAQIKNKIPNSIIQNYLAKRNNKVFQTPYEAGQYLKTEYSMYYEANKQMTQYVNILGQHKEYGKNVLEWINSYNAKNGNAQPEYEIIDKVNEIASNVEATEDNNIYEQRFHMSTQPEQFSYEYRVDAQWKEMMEWINDVQTKEDLTEKYTGMTTVAQKLHLMEQLDTYNDKQFTKKFTEKFNQWHNVNKTFFHLPDVVIQIEKDMAKYKIKMDIAREVQRMRKDDNDFKGMASTFINEMGQYRAKLIQKYQQQYSSQLTQFNKNTDKLYQKYYDALNKFYKVSMLSNTFNVSCEMNDIRKDRTLNLKQSLTKCINTIINFTKMEKTIEKNRVLVEQKLTQSQLNDMEMKFWKGKEETLTTLQVYEHWNIFYDQIIKGTLKPPPVDTRTDQQVQKELLEEIWEVRNDWKKL